MSEKKQSKTSHKKRPMEPEWIDLEDLEEDISEENDAEEELEENEQKIKHSPKRPAPENAEAPRRNSPHKTPASKTASHKKTSGRNTPPGKSSRKKKSGINFHVILLGAIAAVFVVIAFKLLFWDKREHHNTERENDTTLSFDTEALDSIIPLDASDTSEKEIDDDLRILFVGNGSLADDKTSDTNLANIVQKKANATVYNCAIPGSYLSMEHHNYSNDFPYDAFSFYYLCTIFTMGNTDTISWAEGDIGGFSEEIAQSIDELQSIDYSQLDVLCIYYDASDYLEQREIIDFDNEGDPTTFCGALHSGIELIKEKFPHIRIIVMSPTYAYVVEDSGNYSSSFDTTILEEPLSTYIGMQAQTCMGDNVSFVDNFYGSVYEEIADEYLKDNILLNEKGQELLADRFLDALNRFHDYDF